MATTEQEKLVAEQPSHKIGYLRALIYKLKGMELMGSQLGMDIVLVPMTPEEARMSAEALERDRVALLDVPKKS